MEKLLEFIDFKLVVLIVFSAYWLKNFFENLLPQLNLKYKVLIWTTLLSALYYFVIVKVLKQEIEVYNLVITYFAATSFYELGFKPLEKFVKGLAGKK